MWNLIKKIDLADAFKRFPIACFWSIVGTGLCIYLIGHDDIEPTSLSIYIKLFIISTLAFLSSIALRLAKEASIIFQVQLNIIRALLILLFIVGYAYMPDNFDVHNTKLFRLPFQIVGLYVILHLIVSFIPYTNNGTDADFWEYNRRVFLRFVESAFFSLFLFLTLSLALVALDKLFGIDVESEAYGYLLTVLLGVFHSWYFLSKFPQLDYDGLVERPQKSFLIFSQYLLIPITIVYMIILYAYAIKIGLSWELPKGWVGQLSIWFCVMGLFTFLLNYFNDQFSQLRMVSVFKKYFFWVLIVPVILLFISTYKRIIDYGITENRYILALLTVWLLLMIVIYGINKNVKLKWIPISLAFFVAFSLFSGPINMFSATVQNQKSKLHDALLNGGYIDEGKIVAKEGEAPDGNRTLFNLIQFLDDRSDMRFVNDWIDDPIEFHDESGSQEVYKSNTSLIVKLLGLGIYVPEMNYNQREYFHFQSDDQFSFSIEGYDRMFLIEDFSGRTDRNKSKYVKLNDDLTQIIVSYDSISINIPLKPYIDSMSKFESGDQLDAANMTFTHNDSDLILNIYIRYISGHKSVDNVAIENISGMLFVDEN